MLTLRLSQLPATILGIYGPAGNVLAERMRYLHPDAAASYLAMEASPIRPRASDMFRSAEASAQARREKRGVQRPGWSGHGFGLSVDLDVDWMMTEYRMTKDELDAHMKSQGWACHRKDHRLDTEAWHYNFFGQWMGVYLDASRRFSSTSAGLEAMIQHQYGAQLTLEPTELQTALAELRLYGGEIDGDLGPLSIEAIRAFQRTWDLAQDGTAGPETQRLLAFVTAQREIVPPTVSLVA